MSLSLHVKLSKLYLEWAKEDSEKYEEAFNYVIKVEARRPFPHSLEWYQTMVEVLKVRLITLNAFSILTSLISTLLWAWHF